ncbi:MAG: hypothetical protein G3M78_12725 [Candidatus Nitrohelix vancouverensis]|uniref:SPOR domain-containing protein n=1 Tax=Candidatus Nitrohelix vancouverensis TaxID=2705534 RepID=A0A7T0G4A1_9BACT|nr:MAG: hypothetical protein G3M78_12725 [Candidatus Nitrohelix vancouverensis]
MNRFGYSLILLVPALYLVFAVEFSGAQSVEVMVKNPKTMSSSSGRTEVPYMVQLNSYRNRKNAEKFITTIKNKGYTPSLVVTGVNKPWFRVRLGPYPTREEAVRISKELKLQFGVSPMVFRAKEETLRVEKVSPAPPAEPEPSVEEVVGETLADEESAIVEGDGLENVFSQFLFWVKAWQSNDAASYLSFYSKSYQGDEGSRARWMKERKKALSKGKNIVIEVSDVHLEAIGNRIQMTFIQNYRSNAFADKGKKTLEWVREDDAWKIIGELWTPLS